MVKCDFCDVACGNAWCPAREKKKVKKKLPREATKRELETMLSQIENNDNIAIFNARKALYIYIDDDNLIKEIVNYVNGKLEDLNGTNKGDLEST